MKRGGSLSFLVGTIRDVLVMEIGWTDVGSGGYILVSCAHSNANYFLSRLRINNVKISILHQVSSAGSCGPLVLLMTEIKFINF